MASIFLKVGKIAAPQKLPELRLLFVPAAWGELFGAALIIF
jgi:hypothetical protein